MSHPDVSQEFLKYPRRGSVLSDTRIEPQYLRDRLTSWYSMGTGKHTVHKKNNNTSPSPFTRLCLFELGKKRVPFPPRPLPSDEEGRKSTFSFTFSLFSPSVAPSPCFHLARARRRASHRFSTAARGTFGYFTFNFISSALTALSGSWENYVTGQTRSAQRGERKGRSRKSRVEIK